MGEQGRIAGGSSVGPGRLWFHWVGGQETRWFDGVEQGRLVEVPSYLLCQTALPCGRSLSTSFQREPRSAGF